MGLCGVGPCFSSFWQVLHDITMLFTYFFVLHILYHLEAMKMTF